MRRIFLYEFVTGGGFLGDGWGWPPESLLREGAAMARAVRADLAALGVKVAGLLDWRLQSDFTNAAGGKTEGNAISPPVPLPKRERDDSGSGFRVVRSVEEERAAVEEMAAACDGTIVIAPEFGHALLERCRWVETAGARLLGPGPAVVQLASDKHATAQRLTAFGLSTPQGSMVEPGGAIPSDTDFPAIGKPLLGAGSQGVRLLADRAEAEAWLAGLACPSRLERFCPGVAASVAVLCGPAGVFPLVPCRQHLSRDGRFAYHGGSLPLEASLSHRATDLALRSIAALPGAVGYLGVDLVLGAAGDGRDDAVIEINPRLTTSYVGLRAAVAPGANLAAAILAACEGRQPRLSFRSVAIQFEADGTWEEIGVRNQELEVGSP